MNSARIIGALVLGAGLFGPTTACGTDCKALSVPDSVVVTVPIELAKPPVEICIDSRCYAGDGSGPSASDKPLLNGVVLSLKLSGTLPTHSVELKVSIGSLSDTVSTIPIVSHLRGEGCGAERSITIRFDTNGKLVPPI